MPKKEVIASAPSETMPFSKVIGFGDLVFVSGQVGIRPDNGEIGPDIESQTRQTMENVQTELTRAGLTMDHVLKATVFLVNMSLFKEMNDVYRSFFKNDPPARSCVEVSALPHPEAIVEVEVIAGRS